MAATIPSNGLTIDNGIPFPATPSAQTDANTLDEYEEGTFTPTLSSSGASFTYYSQKGIYTKIGNKVICSIQIITNDIASGTSGNVVTIEGLPFTIINVSARPVEGGAIGFALNWANATTSQPHFALCTNNSTEGTLFGSDGGQLTYGDMADGTTKNYIYVTYSYTAAT